MRWGHPSTLALQALVHPGTLGCVAVLWLNDAVLKGLWPGFVTGKLSDVVGLAFFPLVLAVAVGAVCRSPGITLAVSTAVTGVWFAATKTAPGVADATESLVTMLSGRPAHIVADPTDLLALPALAWPLVAWRAPRPDVGISALRSATLMLAAFLSLATSVDCPDKGPRNLTVHPSGTVVADGPVAPTLMSTDGGRTWRRSDRAAARRLDFPAAHRSAPPAAGAPRAHGVGCFPSAPTHCFRIGVGTAVEESIDGGASWRRVWRYPEGRHEFVVRSGEGVCDYSVTVTDLVVVEHPESAVLVAASDHGIVRRGGDGAWTSADVNLDSVGLATTALGHHIAPEVTVAVAGTFLLYAVLSSFATSRLGGRTRGRTQHAPAGRPGWIGAVVSALVIVLAISLGVDAEGGGSGPFGLLLLVPAQFVAGMICLLSLARIGRRWNDLEAHHATQDLVLRLRRRTAWSAVGFGVLTGGAALAWSGGLIARLGTVYGTMLLAGALVPVVWWVLISHMLADRDREWADAARAADVPSDG